MLYGKLAAVAFAATLVDTEDLATIRGSSAAALRLVPALADHLQATLRPEVVRVDRLCASASQAVIRWSTGPRAGTGALCARAEGGRKASRVQIAALEGIDRADLEIDRVREARFGRADDADAWSLALVGIGDRVRAAAGLLARTGRSQLHRWLRAAGRDGLLGTSGAEAVAWRKTMLGRLHDLGLADADLAILTDDRLGRGSRYPLLPLRQLLELADLLEASRLGGSP